MPSYQKPATGRDKNSKSPQSGSRSPGHRGHRADQSPAPKKRWNADERAARAGQSAQGSRDDRRPDWTPRDKPARTERPAYGDRKPDGDRPQRDDRRPDWTPR
ncbi:MAG: ATP-dependent helicase, partial [Rhodoglobus sp.]|nr:ATP-dependent helicase [Rhodoglobus sp.]